MRLSEFSAPMTRRSEGPTRAFVNMHAQSENAGDALVLRELINLISSRVPTDLYLGNWPDTFVRQLGVLGNSAVTTHPGRNTVGLVSDILWARLQHCRCYYFLTAGAPHGERTLKQFLGDLIRIAWLAVLAAFGVRICQVGVSFESIGPRHARVLRWRSRFLHASVPRDETSYSYMRDLGIRATDIMPDVTLNLFLSPRTLYESARNRIAFSFRTDKYPDIRSNLVDIVTSICTEAPENTQFLVVSQVRRDETFMRYLYDVIASDWPGRVEFVDCHRDIDKAFALYRTCDSVLSNRLHALLPALKEGATPVALLVPELDPKISGVFDSIGLNGQVLDFSSLSAESVHRRMAPIAFEGSDIAKILNEFFDKLFVLGDCA